MLPNHSLLMQKKLFRQENYLQIKHIVMQQQNYRSPQPNARNLSLDTRIRLFPKATNSSIIIHTPVREESYIQPRSASSTSFMLSETNHKNDFSEVCELSNISTFLSGQREQNSKTKPLQMVMGRGHKQCQNRWSSVGFNWDMLKIQSDVVLKPLTLSKENFKQEEDNQDMKSTTADLTQHIKKYNCFHYKMPKPIIKKFKRPNITTLQNIKSPYITTVMTTKSVIGSFFDKAEVSNSTQKKPQEIIERRSQEKTKRKEVPLLEVPQTPEEDLQYSYRKNKTSTHADNYQSLNFFQSVNSMDQGPRNHRSNSLQNSSMIKSMIDQVMQNTKNFDQFIEEVKLKYWK